MDEKELYKTIARELDANRMDPARWTQAFAEAEGDREKARAIYIRLRHADLAPRTSSAQTPSEADGLRSLRARLATALHATGRDSLYRKIGLQPTATDDSIAETIRSHKESGTPMDAELRYAVDTLGDAAERARYDRSLAASVLGGAADTPDSDGDGLQEIRDETPYNAFLAWWATRKVTVLVGAAVVALLGFVALPYYQTQTVAGIVDQATAMEETRRERQEQWKVQEAERREAQRAAAQKRQAAYDARRERQEQDQLLRRFDQDNRSNAYAQRREAQQARAEAQRERYERQQRQRLAAQEARQADARAAQEAAYWSCFNDAISREDSAYAYRKCAYLKR
ncbi:MAG: hypothetical protein KDH16_13185 [Rhodocyclaceae bacterium]|nr:hypothetical protein [Rhodocyclaceae bacterium]